MNRQRRLGRAPDPDMPEKDVPTIPDPSKKTPRMRAPVRVDDFTLGDTLPRFPVVKPHPWRLSEPFSE